MSSLRERFRASRIRYANMRRARRALAPYLWVDLSGELSEIPPHSPEVPFRGLIGRFVSIPGTPQSAHWLRTLFDRIAMDTRVQGVVLHIGCQASAAVYESLREAILNFRKRGKRVIAYAETLGPFQYFLACACDQIVMPPSAEFNVLGFSNEYVFFKEALDKLGVGVDVVNVSPYKSAGDQFARTDFSPESRAQAEWLLDARFDAVIEGIAQGRGLSTEQARALIDGAPYGAREAVDHKLIDATLYEDELAHWLMPERSENAKPTQAPLSKLLNRISPKLAAQWIQQAGSAQESSTLTRLEDAASTLLLPTHRFFEKRIGVVGVEGLIMMGPSRKSPLPIPLPVFGEAGMAGAASVAQALRRAERDDNIAAVVLYVDSQGGDALASDLIARELERVRKKKPVVAYMSGVAASGGYYVSALAQKIIARPLTITGSIGVILTKPHTGGFFDKLGLNRTALTRGANADLYSDRVPLGDRERGVLAGAIGRIYSTFKDIVTRGRELHRDNPEALEALCGGRVWTGAQAQAHGLVDTLGGFQVAVEQATALAGLNPGSKRVGWSWVTPGKKGLLPLDFAALTPATWLAHVEALRREFGAARAWLIAPIDAAASR
jgi:protease-4